MLYRHHTICLGSIRSFPCHACLSSDRSTYTWHSASKLGQQWILPGTWRLGSEWLVRHPATRVGQPHSLPATFSALPFKVQSYRQDCSPAHFWFHACWLHLQHVHAAALTQRTAIEECSCNRVLQLQCTCSGSASSSLGTSTHNKLRMHHIASYCGPQYSLLAATSWPESSPALLGCTAYRFPS